MQIKVWYYGVNNQTYITDVAGVIFNLTVDGKEVVVSNQNTLSRQDINFCNGYNKLLTLQIGQSFKYDNTIENNLPYKNSFLVEKSRNFIERKRKNLTLGEKICGQIIKGNLVDFKKECVGFVSLDIYSETEQTIVVSFGEYLTDKGTVLRIWEERDFSFEYVLKPGENKLFNSFRRCGLRYIDIESEKPIKINEVAILPVNYPLTTVPYKLENDLDQRIYDTCVYTLRSCMHEHYEDCPWREQALYSMDGFNEMRGGFYAFNEIEYARYNLMFISRGIRSDGLLSICYPTGRDIPIPSFSLVYFRTVEEYVKFTNDRSVLPEILPVLKKIKEAFESRIDENNLIPCFEFPCWNFYEWSVGSDREYQITRKPEDVEPRKYDLIINCMYLYAMQSYCNLTGEVIDFEPMKKAINDTFYVNGLYKLCTDGEIYGQLGNVFAVLSGVADKSLVEKIINDKSLVPCTLSMKTFLYEAVDDKDFILNDIRNDYSYMLDAGATTFWETINGVKIDVAGSLCHGWSTIPIIYFNKYLNKK